MALNRVYDRVIIAKVFKIPIILCLVRQHKHSSKIFFYSVLTIKIKKIKCFRKIQIARGLIIFNSLVALTMELNLKKEPRHIN